MNIIKTAQDMKIILVKRLTESQKNNAEFISRKIGYENDIGHLLWMLKEIENLSITGEKAHRWVGFVQGVCHAYQYETVQSFKKINKAN